MTMNIENPTQSPKQKKTVQPSNGVNTPALFATIDAVRAQPELAQFRFRATNRWQSGTHSRSQMESFDGAGSVHQHASDYASDADHPAVLCGDDNGPTPVEFLLHALAACLTAGIANMAAARGITLTAVESNIEGDIDLQGILGLDDEVRNGYQQIRLSFTIKGDAGAEELAQLVERSQARSAVYDVLSNGCPIAIDVLAG